MTEDRYEVNHTLYVVGLISLLCSLSLTFFALYILPNLLWDLAYTVPDAVTSWHVWLQEEQDWTDRGSAWLIFSVLMVPGILLGFVSYWASNRLDEGLPNLLPPKEIELAPTEEAVEVDEEKRELSSPLPWRLTAKILIGCTLIILVMSMIYRWIR